MKKELKIRITDQGAIEKRLVKAGAKFLKQATSTYIYFNQPEGKVWKITKNDEGLFETILEKDEEYFRIIKNAPVSNTKELEELLIRELGIKKKLKNIRRFYKYQQFIISTNQIEGVGLFLIIEGRNPTIKIVEEILQMKNPEIVTKSFDQV